MNHTDLIYLCRPCAAKSDRFWNVLIYGFVAIAVLAAATCLYQWWYRL